MKISALILVLFAATALACGGSSGTEKADDYTSAMAKEHADDTAAASEAVKDVTSAVDSETVTYATLGDQAIQGHLTRPKGVTGDLPALIVIHEWWGLNDNIRNMADQLAAQGYLVLAVDLYAGKNADKPEDAKALMQGAMADAAPLQENLRQAHAYLKQAGATKIGVMGWCFGGAWSLQTGLLMPEGIDAMVIYYGHLVTDEESLKPLDMPILGIFGGLDKGIPVATVRAFETSLKNLNKDAAIHVYDDADHAFANPSGQHYNAVAAQDAWAKTTAFLARHLK